MHIRILLCLILSAAPVIHASDAQDLITPKTCDGKAITPETLLGLSDKFDGSSLQLNPKESAHYNMNSACVDKDDKIYAWIKISGQTNRIFTGMHTNGADGRVWSDQQYLHKQMAYLTQHPVATYQTASRAACYLIAKEAIYREGLTGVGVPSTALYSTNGSSIDDDHAIIKETHIAGEKLERWLLEGHEVATFRLKELFRLTELVGLWSLRNNIIVNQDNTLIDIDLELPNNSRSQDFLYKDPTCYHGNVVCGIKELFAIFTYPEARRTLIEMIDLSDILSHEQFTQRYQKEIIDFAASSADKHTFS